MHRFRDASKGFAEQIWRRDIGRARFSLLDYSCGQQMSSEEASIGGQHERIAAFYSIRDVGSGDCIARHVRDGGATVLRGGVYKPRTSPYSFQGLGLEALKWMRATGDELGMPI